MFLVGFNYFAVHNFRNSLSSCCHWSRILNQLPYLRVWTMEVLISSLAKVNWMSNDFLKSRNVQENFWMSFVSCSRSSFDMLFLHHISREIGKKWINALNLVLILLLPVLLGDIWIKYIFIWCDLRTFGWSCACNWCYYKQCFGKSGRC